MNTKANRASLVSVSDTTAEMVLLLADIKELHAKAVSLLNDDAAEEAQKDALNAYHGFWQAQLLKMITNNIEANETEL